MKEKAKNRTVKKTSPPDYVFIGLIVALTVFGFIALSSASSDLMAQAGDSFYSVKIQFFNFLLAGVPGFFAALFVPYRWLKKMAVPLFLIALILLILVFIPGIGERKNGASRWVNFHGIRFQPGEFMKLAIIIFFAAWLSGDPKRAKSFTGGFIPFVVVLGLVMLLFFLQPATTIAVITGAACFIIYFVSGLPYKYLALLVLLGIIAVTFLVTVTNYRFDRILTYVKHNFGMDTSKDFERGEGYQTKKISFALRSGGLLGVGFGKSATKTTIPEVQGDAIFAVIAEEFGFVGSSLFIFAFVFLAWRGFRIAQNVSDGFGKFLVIGFTSMITIQALINIGAMSGIFPLTGVPLPFVSYGGTALAMFLTMSGIIANISMYRRGV